MPFTLLVASTFFEDKRKCVVEATSLDELILQVATTLGCPAQGSPLGLSLLESDGTTTPLYDIKDVPPKAKVMLEAQQAPAHLLASQVAAQPATPGGVQEGVPPIGFIDAAQQQPGTVAPAARNLLLLVTGAGGLDNTPRKCKVSASTVGELTAALETSYAAGALSVEYNGVTVSDLQVLPDKAKVVVTPTTGGGGGGAAVDAQFVLSVTSDLFDGERRVGVDAVDCAELCDALQASLGLPMPLDVLYTDPDFPAAGLNHVLSLEDLDGVSAVVVCPASGVRATSNGHAHGMMSPVVEIQPPPAPQAPVLAFATADTLDVQWSAVEGVLGYNIEVLDAAEDSWRPLGVRFKTTSACLDGFGPVTSHVVRVIAVNSAGAGPPSEQSEPLTTEPGVPAPTQGATQTSVESSSIALTWGAPEDHGAPIENYIVEQRVETSEPGGWMVVGSSTENAIAAENLQPATAYCFRVTAVNRAGHGKPGVPSEPFTTKPGAPSQPGPPSLMQAGATSLSISWQASLEHGSALTGYTLERCGPDGEWAAVAEGLDATEFVDEGLRPLTTTRYRVGAANGVGESAVSRESAPMQTTAAVPAQPEAPTSTQVTPTALTVSWEAPDDFNTPIESYCVEQRGPGHQSEWAVVETLPGDTTFYSCQQLQPASSYFFRVTATSAVGNSEQGVESGPIQTRAAVPSRPFAPSMGAVTSSTLELKWLAPADNGSPISSYRCELVDAFEPDAPWTLVNEGPELTVVAEGLAPATEYKCRVVATNAEGDSSKGEESLFKTMADAPDAPAAPVLIANAPSCITLQWSIPASNGAPITSYTVERRLKGSMDWTVAVADTPSNECQVPKSDAAETVFFRVCAINSGGTSDFGDASEEIACEKAARKLLLMVSSDDGLLSAGVSRKVTLEVGSMAEMTDALQRKLAIVEPLQVFLGEGSAAQPCTSLEQLPDKAKVLVRAIRVAAPASAPPSNDGKRNFKLLVTSPLFAENKKISCSAGSAEELTQTLKQMLNLTQPIGVVIHDKDFDEDRLIADLDDLESDKERVKSCRFSKH